MPAAAKVTSLTGHGTPLSPGPGCPTVMIGFTPAWRALPAAMATSVQSISNLMNSFMVRSQMTPVDGTASLIGISQSLVQGGAAAAAAGAPAAVATALSSVATLNVTNVALSATWLAASVVPGGQPAANIAYTEGIKAAAAAAASAVMASMAGLSDMHICPIPVPIPPHGPGFVTMGSSSVVIGNLTAARQTDQVFEACGGPDPIAMGFPTVMIGDISAQCEFLTKGQLVSGTDAQFDRNRKPPTVTTPGTATTHTFPGDTAPQAATEYQVVVDGKTIKVIMPVAAPKEAGTHLPSVDEVAQGLGAVPTGQLATIKQVEVSPNRNPSDAYWATQYHTPGFRSAAVGGDGGVTMFPTPSQLPQARVDSNLIHEGGHTFQSEIWKDAATKQAWADAIKNDPRSPSTYADNSIGEDMSESLVMYSLSKGTPCEQSAKNMFPSRYAELDRLMKK